MLSLLGTSQYGFVRTPKPGVGGSSPSTPAKGQLYCNINKLKGSHFESPFDAAWAKAFFAAHGVAIAEDDQPQIDLSSSRANRAASISARVTCLQN
jgi:hypothetical protein